MDKLVHILGPYAQGNRVHAAEGFEQNALALHDRHARLGADIAQTQHGGAVGDDRYGIAPAGQLIGFGRVLLDLDTGRGHARGVGQGEGVLVVHGHFGYSFQLAFPFRV